MSTHVSRRNNDQEFAELLEQFDLEEWLDDEGVDYTIKAGSSGEQINIKTCPRCGGSQHKVFLNRETGLGNCFHGSCVGEPGFNKFTFIAHYTGEENGVVFEIIKDQLEERGWRPPRPKRTVVTHRPTTVELPESCELPINGRNLKYLTNRHITQETTAHFKLRYSTEGVYWYTDYNGKRKRQDYSKRIIIPIYDTKGELITFQGRDVTGTQDKKYLFPPMLPSTGRYMYNANSVSSDTRHAVIGEGVFDVMAIHQALTDKSVMVIGSFGISLSSGAGQQLSELKNLTEKGVKRFTFMWDGGLKATKAAFKAAMKVAEHLSVPVYVARLPDGKDPNEVSPETITEAIDAAIPASRLNFMKFMVAQRR